MERLETCPEETLVVGDRLETDILGAQIMQVSYCNCVIRCIFD
jgi:predicted HAD superfamily phosphohydrolase YqeG